MLLDGHPDLGALPFEHWHTPSKGRFPGAILESFAGLSAKDKLTITKLTGQLRNKIEKAHGSRSAFVFRKLLTRDAETAATSPELYGLFADRYFRTFHGVIPSPIALILSLCFRQFRGTGSSQRIVNHCGNLALMAPEELDQVFGPSTKVVIWRDPRAVYASSKAAAIRHGKAATRAELEEFCVEYEAAYINYYGSQNFSIRFEDLVRAPEACMRSLALCLNIDFHPSLLVPTILGTPAGANTSFERAHGVVDASAAADWEARIDTDDRAAIEDRLAYIIDAFGRPRPGP